MSFLVYDNDDVIDNVIDNVIDLLLILFTIHQPFNLKLLAFKMLVLNF